MKSILKRLIAVWTAAAAGAVFLVANLRAAPAHVRHLFLDPAFVQEATGAALKVNPPRMDTVVIRRDKPWEEFMITFYLTVLDDGGKLRMWYVCRDSKKAPNLAYAESNDGVNWTKPELGLTEYHGSKANNLVGVGSLEGSVFRDPHPRDESERYVYVSTVFKGGGIYRFTSPDGLAWKRDARPFLPFEADSQNVTFRDPNIGRYVSYLRGWNISKPFGLGRKVVRLESDRLDRPSGVVPAARGKVRPSDPDRDPWINEEIPTVLVCDDRDPKITDIYTNAIQPYPLDPTWYVGFPAFYRHAVNSVHHNDGWTEIEFVGSQDGKTWERYGRGSYIRPGLENSETAGMVYIGPGLVVRGDEIWQYGTTYRTTHGDAAAREKQGDGVIRRYVHRIDGFVSLDFAAEGGHAVCGPVSVTGAAMLLNVDTGALGSVRIGLRTPAGEKIPGFGEDDCDLLRINSTHAEVHWHGGGDLASLRGKDVRVAIEGVRAKLYSLRFE
jgi:hypothetical protein